MESMDLTELSRHHGDTPAVIASATGETLTYGQLEERSNRLAHHFRAAGLAPGDHVALLMENSLDLFPVVWAAQRAGLLYTPVNHHLTDDEATYIVANCGARLLLHSDLLAPLAADVGAVLPDLVVESVPGLWAGRLEGLPSSPVDDQLEGYYMLYSSGTTGRPKGILPELSGQEFGTGLPIDSTMRDAFGFGPGTVYLSPGPLYHAAPLGWSMGTIRNGGTVVMMERFDAEEALAAIRDHRVTHAQFVPTMFVRMLKLPDGVRESYDVSSLQVVVHAGAPCPVEVKERVIEWLGPKVIEFYAGSEGNGFFMITTPEWLAHRGSVGRPLVGEVHILDEAGEELPPGEIGTVWFGGVRRFEYHGEPGKTAEVFNDRGWSTLGDLGHVDEEGYLYLADRRTDLVISGGVNVYPREIEDVLITHPCVLDVAVIGVPDEDLGRVPHAVVTPVDAGEAGPELERELIAFARERLAHFKCPRTVEFGEVPRLPSGKLLKRALMVTR